MSGYIKIDRKILEWEWYKNEHTKNVFFHCLLKANWKDGKFEGIIVPRGSFVTSVKKMAMELDLTDEEVRTALLHLINTGELTKQTTNRFTVISVSNYDLYQDFTEQIPNESKTDTEQLLNNSQTIPKPFPTIEEYKEIKEGKKVKREEDILTDSKESVCQIDIRRIVERWNELARYGIKPIIRLVPSAKRYDNLRARIREYGLENIFAAIDRIKNSDFLQGKNNRGWSITFDWFVLPSNFPKVLEGKYDNPGETNNEFSSEMEAFINGQN